MRRARIAFSFSLVLALTSSAFAQLRTTYVSAATGDDANPCDQASPCRQVNRALAETLVGGEVIVDAGTYAKFTLDKSGTVSAVPGTQPLLLGVLVNMPAGHSGTVRGLKSVGSGGASIFIAGAGSTTVESCEVASSASGLMIQASGPVVVKDTTVRNNVCFGCPGAPNGYAIQVRPAAGSKGNVTIERCRVVSNQYGGIYAHAPGGVAVRDTTVTGNPNGIVGFSSGGGLEMSVANCVITKNQGIGISARTTYVGTVRILVSGSTISGNQTGVNTDGQGSVIIGERNRLSGNGTDGEITPP